jgi:hypothetical protein
MLFFWLAYSIAVVLIYIVAVFQAVVVVFTGQINDTVHRFGNNLTIYLTHIFQFVTFNSEHLPFPFADWPNEEPSPSPWTKTTAVDDVDTYADTPEPNAPADDVAAGNPDPSDEEVASDTDNNPPKTDLYP